MQVQLHPAELSELLHAANHTRRWSGEQMPALTFNLTGSVLNKCLGTALGLQEEQHHVEDAGQCQSGLEAPETGNIDTSPLQDPIRPDILSSHHVGRAHAFAACPKRSVALVNRTACMRNTQDAAEG